MSQIHKHTKTLTNVQPSWPLCYITWHVQTLKKTEHNFSGTKKIIKETRKRKRKRKRKMMKMMIWRMMALDTVSEIYFNIMFKSQSGIECSISSLLLILNILLLIPK